MSLDDTNNRKFLRIAFGSALAAILVVAVSAGSVRAADDGEEDEWYDIKILRGIMRGVGLKRDEPAINYRERSPLVVPPSTNLPPPETDAVAERNPAWPDDPDVKRRKQAAKRTGEATAARQEYEDGKALPPDQLRRGTTARNSTGASGGRSNDDVTTGRPVKPSELGWMGSMFDVKSWFGQKEEYAKFDGEPSRNYLTQPPAGYQTPSPSQPYGVGPKSEKAKPKTLEDRAEGIKQ
jgi:hypothetical protein